jgi:hypothetical protein
MNIRPLQSFFSVIVFASMALLIASCSNTTGLLPDAFRVMSERRAGPVPESEWNRLEIWQKISDSPPTYIPKDYSRSLPRTESEGVWFVDKRDGKRLFAPNQTVGSYKPGVLRGEAAKITKWKIPCQMHGKIPCRLVVPTSVR